MKTVKKVQTGRTSIGYSGGQGVTRKLTKREQRAQAKLMGL